MRNHIALRELAGFASNIAPRKRRSGPGRSSCPIDLLVNRARERPIAACANPQPDLVEPETSREWRFVSLSGLSKNGCPLCFRGCRYRGDDSPMASDGAPVPVVEPASDCCWALIVPRKPDIVRLPRGTRGSMPTAQPIRRIHDGPNPDRRGPGNASQPPRRSSFGRFSVLINAHDVALPPMGKAIHLQFRAIRPSGDGPAGQLVPTPAVPGTTAWYFFFGDAER